MENPYAFARPIADVHDGSQSDSQTGMTLRDYYAAHAPEMSNMWDKPDFPEAYPQPNDPFPDPPVDAPNLEYDYRRQGWDEMEEGWVPADVEEKYPEWTAGYRAWLTQLPALGKARSQWESRRMLYWLTAWRYAYADAMLAARTQSAK